MKDEALKMALHTLVLWDGRCRLRVIAAIKEALAQPAQKPVATVIEELEHDGEGWCSKVRWLYNPVPVNETLYWEKSN